MLYANLVIFCIFFFMVVLGSFTNHPANTPRQLIALWSIVGLWGHAVYEANYKVGEPVIVERCSEVTVQHPTEETTCFVYEKSFDCRSNFELELTPTEEDLR